jgi:hypothetical protein
MYEIPNLYNISGSANFYNKTDNGITVYRNFLENRTEVYIQKVKFSHWGEIGKVEFNYHLDSGRYIHYTDIENLNNWIDKTILVEEKEPLIIQGSLTDAFGDIYQQETEIPF